ncbi:hypothetical protein THRCLA_21566 [Thraustotheca clavata]|uniref:Uncharacterized protein n=1 Tax=Thraustotheca clavata TaxID=74557 RepID=A0A1V9ZV66_9STRA|nr:hypothetical protein THRCLA_21566 [Thraustotheca clavata]
MASVRGLTDMMSMFILGATINQAKLDGATPLLLAVQFGYANIVPMLLSAGSNVNQTMSVNSNGVKPLIIACQHSHLNIAKELVSAGANVDQTMTDGASHLFIASFKGHKAIVLFLISMGANVHQAMTFTQGE